MNLARRYTLLVLLSCASCLTSFQLPDFIAELRPLPDDAISASERICIVLKESVIWRPGNDGELSEHIISQMRLAIDDHEYNELEISSPFQLLARYDETGKYLGSHDGDMSICVDHDLEVGKHTAMIRTESTTGEEYSFTWQFFVE